MRDERPEKQSEAEDFAEEMIHSAQSYYAENFSRGSGEACPGHLELEQLVMLGAIPGEELREHLLSCSPCFNAFGDLRRKKDPVPPPPLKRMSAAAGARMFGLIFALAASMLIGAAGMYMLIASGDRSGEQAREERSAPTERASVKPQTSPIEPAVSSNVVTKVSETKSGVNTQVSRRSIPEKFMLDVARVEVRRDSLGDPEPVRLPAKKITVVFRLRQGSPTGIYRISLLSEFGEPITETLSTSSSGETTSADIDMTERKGSARLCVGFGDEVPDCFAVNIR